MKRSRAIGLAFVLGCFSVEAATITFSNIKERGGLATDYYNGITFHLNTAVGASAPKLSLCIIH